MPKPQSTLLGLLNSDSEDEFVSHLGFSTSTKPTKAAMAAAKKPARGAAAAAKTTKTAPAANKVTKPAPKKPAASSGRRASGRLATAIENTEEGRAALAERSSNKQPPATARATTANGRKAAAIKDAEVIEGTIVATPPPAVKTKGGRGRPKKNVAAAEEEIADSQSAPAPAPAPAKRGRKPAAAARAEVEIPETQQADPEPEPYPDAEAMDLDLTLDPLLDSVSSTPARVAAPAPMPASAARKAAPYSATRRPALPPTTTSFSSSDNDSVSLRRRIGELTKANASLESRYRDLRDIVVRDAEVNFDRLRKQSDEKAAASQALIECLKAELAVQRELAREGAKHKSQLDVAEARIDTLQQTVTDLTTGLSESKAENKSLSVKLAALRGNGSATVPGSAVKKGGLGMGKAAVGEEIHTAKVLQMKEDLYGDLTGLIVMGVRNVEGEGVFDCLQTGRNGTLHFKLAINKDATSEAYEEAEYRYMPQLDPGRDADLIDILPDYLVEEINFPRPQASKFYARLVRSLTEKPEEVE
ncbi:chromosome segregation protein Csm1/Pcs1-domain-containing protein [Coniochaeta sp. 2T2.1]|nr:chromosome segregation protein Csm1/Pcs1-domain-containing protein [Coniochaeta sp. 2T2.1]